jgi:glycine cleavage system aminomethyltransferase T
MSALASLDTMHRHAGGVMITCGDRTVALHYGSPAGELARCVRSLGIADRSDLGKILVTGAASPVSDLVRRITGAPLTAFGLVWSEGAWWCMEAPGRVLVIVQPAGRTRLFEMLRSTARPVGGVTVREQSSALAAIALLGPLAGAALAAIGALGPQQDLRSAPPFARARIGGVDAFVLLQSDQRALLVTWAGDADRLWHFVEHSTRPLGMSCVGTEAAERFALLERMRARVPNGAS